MSKHLSLCDNPGYTSKHLSKRLLAVSRACHKRTSCVKSFFLFWISLLDLFYLFQVTFFFDLPKCRRNYSYAQTKSIHETKKHAENVLKRMWLNVCFTYNQKPQIHKSGTGTDGDGDTENCTNN